LNQSDRKNAARKSIAARLVTFVADQTLSKHHARQQLKRKNKQMTRLERLTAHWVYGGTIAGLLLLCLTPFLAKGWSVYEMLVFLALPIYMIHQYEEHDGDRFRDFINTEIGHGREALSLSDVFIANVVGVWVTLGIAFALTMSGMQSAGLFAGFLLLVNAVVHIVPTIATRRYNPGLVTAVLVFIPLGAAILANSWSQSSWGDQLAGFGCAFLIHAAIVARVKQRLAVPMRNASAINA
jgi:hypothetical protein